jgi:hypothetical protein
LIAVNTGYEIHKAWALNGLKRHEEALERSNKALELDPNSIPNWYMS